MEHEQEEEGYAVSPSYQEAAAVWGGVGTLHKPRSTRRVRKQLCGGSCRPYPQNKEGLQQAVGTNAWGTRKSTHVDLHPLASARSLQISRNLWESGNQELTEEILNWQNFQFRKFWTIQLPWTVERLEMEKWLSYIQCRPWGGSLNAILLRSSLTGFSESCVSSKVQTRHDNWGANARESKNNLTVTSYVDSKSALEAWFPSSEMLSTTVADHIHLSGLWSKISLLLEEIKINIQYMLWLPSTDSE